MRWRIAAGAMSIADARGRRKASSFAVCATVMMIALDSRRPCPTPATEFDRAPEIVAPPVRVGHVASPWQRRQGCAGVDAGADHHCYRPRVTTSA
jgi:hypothetical protein